MIVVAVLAALVAGACFGRSVALDLYDGVWVLFLLAGAVMVLALWLLARRPGVAVDPAPEASRLDRLDRPGGCCLVDHSADAFDERD